MQDDCFEFTHPIDKLINELKRLNDINEGYTWDAYHIRKEIHSIFVHERGEIEGARIDGKWMYNDEPWHDKDWEDFVAYWADVLML